MARYFIPWSYETFEILIGFRNLYSIDIKYLKYRSGDESQCESKSNIKMDMQSVLFTTRWGNQCERK